MTYARLGPDDVLRRAFDQRRKHQQGSSRTTAVAISLAVVVVGGLLIMLGLNVSNDASAPTCDGQTMQSGDNCVAIGGNASSYDYQQGVDNRHTAGQVMTVLGAVAVGVAFMVGLASISRFNPARPWGALIPVPCPRCGQFNLQEKPLSVSRSQGQTVYSVTGIATVCAPECGFGTVRKPAR